MRPFEKKALNKFLNGMSFQERIYSVDVETASFHSLFDYFSRCYEEELKEVMVGIVDRINEVHNVFEMKNIFRTFLRERTDGNYKRTPDQWGELQIYLEDRFAYLVDRIIPNHPHPDFFKMIEDGEWLMENLTTKRAAKALVNKVLEMNQIKERECLKKV